MYEWVSEDSYDLAGRGQSGGWIEALAMPAGLAITGWKGLWLSGHPLPLWGALQIRVLCWGADFSQVLEGACCVWPSPQSSPWHLAG